MNDYTLSMGAREKDNNARLTNQLAIDYQCANVRLLVLSTTKHGVCTVIID